MNDNQLVLIAWLQIVIGVVLLIIALLFAVSFLDIVINVFTKPDEVVIIQWAADRLGADQSLFKGNWLGQPVDIIVSVQLLSLPYALLGIIIIASIGGIIKSIIESAISVLRSGIRMLPERTNESL